MDVGTGPVNVIVVDQSLCKTRRNSSRSKMSTYFPRKEATSTRPLSAWTLRTFGPFRVGANLKTALSTSVGWQPNVDVGLRRPSDAEWKGLTKLHFETGPDVRHPEDLVRNRRDVGGIRPPVVSREWVIPSGS